MKEVADQQKAGLEQFKINGGSRMHWPAILAMCVAALCLLFLTVGSESLSTRIERPYLIPWVIATGIVVAAPSVYLKWKGDFSFTNPLVFAALTYFFPVFFLGGWSLAFGLSHYYFLNYVTDPEYNFPLTFVYIMVGYAGLSVGYFIPTGKSIGNYVSKWLPKWEFTLEEIVVACVFCLIVGFCLNILALEVGQIGYQSGDFLFGETGSLTYYLTIVLPSSSFLLWLAFFKFEKWNFLHLVIAGAQVITAIFMLVVLGGKSGLLLSAVLAIGAFVLVRQQITFKHWAIFGGILAFCLVAGTIYGTNFRATKGNYERMSASEYGSVAVESITSLGDSGISSQLSESFEQLANRLEVVSALAVVVANHEALSTYEASYGLENNIWTYTWTALIPRFLWKDKPIIADGFSYNELYFDHGGFGLSLTAMGDLLRNFGPIGVPLGMILLGFGIRIFYSMLVEGVTFSAWKSTIYFIVMIKISYDGFYGEILPTMIRVSAVIFVQIVILFVIVQLLRQLRR
jgi:oligosaccharide repeat unit polymerase